MSQWQTCLPWKYYLLFVSFVLYEMHFFIILRVGNKIVKGQIHLRIYTEIQLDDLCFELIEASLCPKRVENTLE